jgi:hypothetical protein
MALVFSTPRDQVETGIFVRLDVDNYRAYEGGPATDQILTFSNYHRSVTIDSREYLPLGNLVNIGSLDGQIKAAPAPIVVSITGIPSSSVKEILASDIKGSQIRIYRGLFDATTGDVAITGGGSGRFNGFVNNYTLVEEWDEELRLAYNTVDLYCTSNIEFFENVVRSRRTNPDSYRSYYDDPSFDRIPTLKNSTFDFGAPPS